MTQKSSRGSHKLTDQSNTDRLAGAFVELQTEVERIELSRGTRREGIEHKLLILSEEVFEIIKVLRHRSGIATAATFDRSSLSDEIADLLFVTAAIANRAEIDLGAIVRDHNFLLRSEARTVAANGNLALQLALRLSAECLRALTLITSVAVEGVTPAEPHSAVTNLVEAARDLAQLESIDVFEAIAKKLNKDQLRLWDAHPELSTIDER